MRHNELYVIILDSIPIQMVKLAEAMQYVIVIHTKNSM